jgi:hypothetical protein
MCRSCTGVNYRERFGRTDLLRRGCSTSPPPGQGTQRSGPRQSPGRGNRGFASSQTKKAAIGRLFDLEVARTPLGCFRSQLALRGNGNEDSRTRSRKASCAGTTEGTRDSGSGARRQEAGGRSAFGAALAQRGESTTLSAPRPIVAAVHSAPPATYGTPGRTGSVRVERPSQGSGLPCAILACRASRAVALSAGAALSSSESPLRSRRLGFR